MCLSLSRSLIWVRERSSGTFHLVFPTGQEPVWGSANEWWAHRYPPSGGWSLPARLVFRASGHGRCPHGCRGPPSDAPLGQEHSHRVHLASVENVPGTRAAAPQEPVCSIGVRVFLPRSTSRGHLGEVGVAVAGIQAPSSLPLSVDPGADTEQGRSLFLDTVLGLPASPLASFYGRSEQQPVGRPPLLPRSCRFKGISVVSAGLDDGKSCLLLGLR